MESTMDMKVLEEQINLTLLNDIIVFAIDTAKADYTQKNSLAKRCMLLNYNARSDGFQQKYGFLYLGELLERYKDRFGMTIQDQRAIALALGYTNPILTNEMFVGNQRNAFLQEVYRNADNDVYLTGALYLLNEGQRGEADWLERLYGLGQNRTEELIFIASLLPDFEQTFLRIKSQLLHLLGAGRTMDLHGNMRILSLLIGSLQPVIKSMRGNDLKLLRALCALPVSFVKEGSKHHTVLLEHGYTPFEIAYANIMAIRCRATPDALRSNSLVTEKIVVDLFRRVFAQEESCSPETYTLLSELFTQYRTFDIRCYGFSELLETLEDVAIQNPDTFIWFSKHAQLCHSVFTSFNILDSKWDRLGTELAEKDYLQLFENGLTSEMDKAEIQRHIDRYNAITGHSYVEQYRRKTHLQNFSLLVEVGILDLWTEFQASIDKSDTVCMPSMLANIRSYIRRLKTIQSFKFFEKFFPQYGFDGYRKYLKPQHADFTEGFLSRNGLNSKVFDINLDRDYLKEDGQRAVMLLYWLEEYLFCYEPSLYISFASRLIQNETATAVIPKRVLRPLFDLVIKTSELTPNEIADLKLQYLTPEELQAEAAAKEAADMEAKHKRELERCQIVRDRYEKGMDGTLAALYKFMTAYSTSSEECSVANQIVRDELPRLLNGKDFTLKHDEPNQLLRICNELVHRKVINFKQAQTYISQTKEDTTYDM